MKTSNQSKTWSGKRFSYVHPTHRWIRFNADRTPDIRQFIVGLESATIENLRWERVEGQVMKTLAATIRYADGRVIYCGCRIMLDPLGASAKAIRAENAFRQAILAAAIRFHPETVMPTK